MSLNLCFSLFGRWPIHDRKREGGPFQGSKCVFKCSQWVEKCADWPINCRFRKYDTARAFCALAVALKTLYEALRVYSASLCCVDLGPSWSAWTSRRTRPGRTGHPRTKGENWDPPNPKECLESICTSVENGERATPWRNMTRMNLASQSKCPYKLYYFQSSVGTG